MNEAVDLVRRQENKALRADGDDRLVGTKYLWLYGEENLPTDRLKLETRMRFAALRSSNLNADCGGRCSTQAQCTGAGNTCVFPNTCMLSTCTGNVVCADTQVEADYCTNALAALPSPP